MFICRYFIYFIIYSFLGWIYETCYCTIHEKAWENRGFLYGPCIPLYGFGALLSQILLIDLPTFTHKEPTYLIIFLVCSIGSFILEYSTSFLLEKRFHARWWDYSDMPLNIHGRVCLLFTICFGFAGIIVTQIVIPPIVELISFFPGLLVELIALIFMLILGMDIALTISALTTFAKEFERINEQINNQMAERVAVFQSNLEDAKVARLEKAAVRKEAAVIKKEMTAEKLAEIKEQLSTEAVKQWLITATETQRGQLRHIAQFTHPVASTKALMEKGSEFLGRKRKH